MGRLMIRMLAFPVAAQLIWRHGMLVRMSGYTPARTHAHARTHARTRKHARTHTSLIVWVDSHRERILLELDPQSSQLTVLMRTTLRGEQMSSLSWLVFAAIDSLVKEWYNLAVRCSFLL
jgi:hypothetical protein